MTLDPSPKGSALRFCRNEGVGMLLSIPNRPPRQKKEAAFQFHWRDLNSTIIYIFTYIIFYTFLKIRAYKVLNTASKIIS